MVRHFHLSGLIIAALAGAILLTLSAIAEPGLKTEKHQISDDAVHTLHEELSAYVAQGHVANLSFGVWQNGLRVTDGFYGPVSATEPATVSDTTIHSIQSMTKPVTAVGLLILLDRGHFQLSDPITNFLPEFEDTETLADVDEDGNFYTYRAPNPPTMAQLLSHTAGFGYWNKDGGPVDRKMFDAATSRSASTDHLVQTAATMPYVSMPGAEWRYSMASDLQGAIIERISGEPLATFLEREVFKPLGMHDTRFYVPAHKQNRLSGVTRSTDSGWVYAKVEDPGQQAQSKTFWEGGHGLYSTQRDYFRFLDFLQNAGRSAIGPLLSPKTLELMRTNAIKYRQRPGRVGSHGGGAGFGYGFGVGIVEDPFVAKMSAPKGTYFWRGAYGTWFWVDPVNDIIFIGMIQSQTPVEPDLLNTAMRAVYGEAAKPVINPPS